MFTAVAEDKVMSEVLGEYDASIFTGTTPRAGSVVEIIPVVFP